MKNRSYRNTALRLLRLLRVDRPVPWISTLEIDGIAAHIECASGVVEIVPETPTRVPDSPTKGEIGPVFTDADHARPVRRNGALCTERGHLPSRHVEDKTDRPGGAIDALLIAGDSDCGFRDLQREV